MVYLCVGVCVRVRVRVCVCVWGGGGGEAWTMLTIKINTADGSPMHNWDTPIFSRTQHEDTI
jgi:hypothetical protein